METNQIEKAAEHLYAAFAAKADIQTENLLWLADLYYNQLEEEPANFALANRAASLLEKCKAALHEEQMVVCKLAKVYTMLGRLDDAIALLEALEPAEKEGQLLLAESYAQKGKIEKALPLFDSIVASSATMRNRISASASLQAARLKLAGEHPDLTKIATQLKNLVIQKTLDAEPVYLEAALEYVELQANADLEKKIALLKKMKNDFEANDDILSKDYHQARSKYPRKDKMYQGYMQLIAAEILAAEAKLDPQNQKDLQAKSKDLLLQIINEQTASALVERANVLLNESKT